MNMPNILKINVIITYDREIGDDGSTQDIYDIEIDDIKRTEEEFLYILFESIDEDKIEYLSIISAYSYSNPHRIDKYRFLNDEDKELYGGTEKDRIDVWNSIKRSYLDENNILLN